MGKKVSSKLLAADLFCGAGGLSVGFERAGYKIIFANDIDQDAEATYRFNHPHTMFFPGSIENLTANKILNTLHMRRGQIDVLIGGPPCQGFSVNAPLRDREDARNHLFQHYGRLVLEGIHPNVVIIENVPGMLSLENGRFVKAIYELFHKAGYTMRHMVLCAAHYGIPQERWRLFFIGTRIKSSQITFPFPTHAAPVRANFTQGGEITWLRKLEGLPLKHYITVEDAISDLPQLRPEEGIEETIYNGGPYTDYQCLMRGDSQVLYNHVAGRLSEQNIDRLRYVPPGGSWRDIPFHLLPAGMQRARRSDHTRRYGRLNPAGLSGTIMTKCDPHWGSYFHYNQDRALTVREAARLQSFPDCFRFIGPRVSQYVQVGNAVPPLLAKRIAEHIKENLLS